MLEQLRERLAAFLQSHSVAVVSAAALCPTGVLPVAYHADGLSLWCLVPRWSELAYHLEAQSSAEALAVISAGDAYAQCWLRYLGVARNVPTSGWPGTLPAGVTAHTLRERYGIIQLLPTRLDLIDERKSWGARETLEL